MNKRNSGKRRQENAVSSVVEIPLAIIQAMSLIHQAAEDRIVQTPEDVAQMRTMLREAYSHLDSVMVFIAGGDCNLGDLALTDGQKEFLRYLFDRFAKGEEIGAGESNPTVVSMV
jgi:hypothetical protein